ncbi:MAG: class I SAM-dependent methyltransferase [Microthrixaceae bacterium]
MVEQSKWEAITSEDPTHSARYIERFARMAEAGNDLDGEARFIDAMAPRGSRILDAGCGPGRVGSTLARLGHQVVGVDVDPVLIAEAERAGHGSTWLVADLAELDLRARGIAEPFDVIVSAGNVMTFLATSTRGDVVARLGAHLADEGRLVVGFGADRGYDFDEFRAHTAEAGLTTDLELGTWDLRPFTDESDFLITVLSR